MAKKGGPTPTKTAKKAAKKVEGVGKDRSSLKSSILKNSKTSGKTSSSKSAKSTKSPMSPKSQGSAKKSPGKIQEGGTVPERGGKKLLTKTSKGSEKKSEKKSDRRRVKSSVKVEEGTAQETARLTSAKGQSASQGKPTSKRAPIEGFGILQKTSKKGGEPKSSEDRANALEMEPSGLTQQKDLQSDFSRKDDPLYNKWVLLKKKFGNLEAPEYRMSASYKEKSPIKHPKWGWGFILNIDNDRLQVLFAEGLKLLISNYKSSI